MNCFPKAEKKDWGTGIRGIEMKEVSAISGSSMGVLVLINSSLILRKAMTGAPLLSGPNPVLPTLWFLFFLRTLK
jgi:hypothetical protein